MLRLLHGLDEQVRAEPGLAEDLEVVVVLDGSTDGSREAIEAEAWAMPVRVVWQANAGLARARNVGLAEAAGRLVWFLDDDLIPAAGLLARHRRGHDAEAPCVLEGRCRIPDSVEAPPALLRWWDAFYADLDAATPITDFDRFTAANTSGPSDLFADVGGFDEDFVGYGLEDYELAVRLLDAGTTIRYDGEAVVWHPDVPTLETMVARERSIGLNAVRIAELHPSTVEALFPPGDSRPRRIIRASHVRRPAALMRMSRAAYHLSRVTRRLHAGASSEAEHLARAASHAAGVVEADPSGALLGRVLDGA